MPEVCSAAATAAASCSTWDNLILLSRHGQAQAGLNDRIAVLRGAAGIAASLCARVVVPKPCELLAYHHNVPTHQPISCEHEWSRYFELNLTESYRAGSRINMLVDRRHVARRVAHMRANPKTCSFINGSAPRDHIRNRNPPPDVVRREVQAQYDEARAAVAHGRTFVWELEHYFFWWGDPIRRRGGREHTEEPALLKKLPEASGGLDGSRSATGGAGGSSTPRVLFTPSALVLQTLGRFEEAVGVPLRSLFGIHIRLPENALGGNWGSCDFSPAALAHWLACDRWVLPPATADESPERRALLRHGFPRKVHFVVFTNGEGSFADAHVRKLRALAGPAGSAHAGDSLIRSFLSADFNRTGNDNYIVMQTIYVLFQQLAAAVRVGVFGNCLKNVTSLATPNTLGQTGMNNNDRHAATCKGMAQMRLDVEDARSSC